MTEKKSYSPPQLFRVELNQEQAILSACSIMTTSAANNGTKRCNVKVFPCKRLSINFGDSGPRPS
ncbi:MAG: hypothetical protein A2V62_09685 [Nitrospirae bacterium RBG_19FT_COMBO_58_9]|nr:MAG: hypothetical protein A2V62_09685 [Nitrospirae bacterium RBG_19FT_COMBO_58_9]